MPELRKGPRGLSAIAQAREDRANRGPKWTATAGLLAAGAVVAGLVTHTVVSQRELSSSKQALLAKQRAVIATLGAEWFPLRDRLEADVLGGAKDYPGDHVEPDAQPNAFRGQPGLYLRMRVADAGSVEDVRRVAADAKKDAFATCLLREPNDRGIRGELDGGAFAEQPWNLGRAYAATRILTDTWSESVKDADEELRMRVLVDQYEHAVRDDIPLAIDVVRRAQFFLLVLDEDTPEALLHADGGHIDEPALQLVDHPARVYMFDLKTNREIFRVRRGGEARVMPAGERQVTDPETLEAMQRQANNCALAASVTYALAPRPQPASAPSAQSPAHGPKATR
jgi:hypothetical protein